MLAGGCRGAQRTASALTTSYSIVLTHWGDEANKDKYGADLLSQLPPNYPVCLFKCVSSVQLPGQSPICKYILVY